MFGFRVVEKSFVIGDEEGDGAKGRMNENGLATGIWIGGLKEKDRFFFILVI